MAGNLPDVKAVRQALTAPGALFELAEEAVRGVTMPVFRNRLGSLGTLLRKSAAFAGRTYIVDREERITFADNLARVETLAAALRANFGVKPGDRVAIFAANRWEWVVSCWAVIAAGAIPCLYNGYWTAEEYDAATRLTEPVLLIADGSRLERVRDRLGTLPAINLDTDLEGILNAPRSAGGRAFTIHEADEDDLSMLVFTSGTTGMPKAVMLAHRSLVGAVQLIAFAEQTKAVMMGGPAPAAGQDLPPNDAVQLVTAPLFHVAMLLAALLNGMGNGSAMVLMRGRFDPAAAIRTVEQERVTNWSLLGSVASRVAASPALARYDTGSLRQLGIGGAPVSPAVQDKLRAAFPALSQTLGMGYSSTEAGGASIANAGGDEFIAHPTSTGNVTVTTQIEIRDERGLKVRDGEYGEVHVRSPYVMLGYWRNAEATVAALKPHGWLATGDIASLEQGRLYINSRARDLIFVNAENVSPIEVEYVLEEHPDVCEVAVLAVDDEITGDAVMAVVVSTADRKPDEGALRSWCAERLAAYKMPTRWHFHDGELPRTASGKLAKQHIRTLTGFSERGNG